MTPNEFRRYALFYLGYYGALGAYTPYVSRWVDALGHGGYVVGAVLALWYGGRILAPPVWSRLTAASATPGRWLWHRTGAGSASGCSTSACRGTDRRSSP